MRKCVVKNIVFVSEDRVFIYRTETLRVPQDVKVVAKIFRTLKLDKTRHQFPLTRKFQGVERRSCNPVKVRVQISLEPTNFSFALAV